MDGRVLMHLISSYYGYTMNVNCTETYRMVAGTNFWYYRRLEL